MDKNQRYETEGTITSDVQVLKLVDHFRRTSPLYKVQLFFLFIWELTRSRIPLLIFPISDLLGLIIPIGNFR